MYSELAEQFLYDKRKFNNTGSKDLLDINCHQCKKEFELTKHQIQTAWRRSTNKILYCGMTCAAASVSKEKVQVDCQQCNKTFHKNKREFNNSKNHFCSLSCAASYNNIKRGEKNKSKQKEIVKKILELKPANEQPTREPKKTSDKKIKPIKKVKIVKEVKIKSSKNKKSKVEKIKVIKVRYKKLTINFKPPFSVSYNIQKVIRTRKIYIGYCMICNKEIKHFTKVLKICSNTCFKLRMRQVHDLYPNLIHNRSTSESYLEKSFREYIEDNGYIKDENYKQEYNFTLKSGKRYIADFYFPDLKIIIEMDGKQHQDTVEEDAIRDNLILEEFKIQTYRVTWKEWNKKTKMELINKLLGI
mgnify:CR=1 FL=1